MFTLNAEQAQAWLAQLNGPDDEAAAGLPGACTVAPAIGPDWNPRQSGEEDSTYLLVRGAQEIGVLSGPPGTEIDFEFSDDADGGYYRFLLDISTPVPAEARHQRHRTPQDRSTERLRHTGRAGDPPRSRAGRQPDAAPAQRIHRSQPTRPPGCRRACRSHAACRSRRAC